MKTDPPPLFVRPSNDRAWALGHPTRYGFSIRRIVWGLLMAQSEQRPGEQIRAARLMVERTHRKRPTISS